jgi:hypothetical protein
LGQPVLQVQTLLIWTGINDKEIFFPQLQELTWIKKQRQLAAPASHIANDKVLPETKPPPENLWK